MTNTPLFVIFVNTSLSIKLVELLTIGKINAIIYCPNALMLNIKKIFSKKMDGKFQIYPLNLPYNFNTFNIFLTSKPFWDNINQEYENIYILHNPRNLSLNITLNTIKQFYILPFIPNTNINKLIWENPSISDEIISQGFIFYIKRKFAIKTLKYFSKNNILTLRRKLNMSNTEHIERQPITPFYMYFHHYMLSIDNNLTENFKLKL